MRRTRRGPAWIAASLAALLVMTFLAPTAGAQDDPTAPPDPVDTDGDGQRDDWDGDGLPDDTDTTDCEYDDKDDAANTGAPDGIPDAAGTPPDVEGCVGEGGTLPDQLSLGSISVILAEVYANMADVTVEGELPDTFPNIPRLIEDGVDVGPDWSVLDRLIGEPGVRDLLQQPDDRINQELLEAEDLNNEQIIDPLDPNRIILLATSEAMDHTLNQIE